MTTKRYPSNSLAAGRQSLVPTQMKSVSCDMLAVQCSVPHSHTWEAGAVCCAVPTYMCTLTD